MFSGTFPETESVIEDLAARGVPQFGLTNMSHETWDGVRAMSPAFRHFRDRGLGPRAGDQARAAHLRDRAGAHGAGARRPAVRRRQPANIEAADALGFHTHHFTDPAALRPAVEKHGLL
jgi:hypothetical protein